MIRPKLKFYPVDSLFPFRGHDSGAIDQNIDLADFASNLIGSFFDTGQRDQIQDHNTRFDSCGGEDVLRNSFEFRLGSGS